MQAYLELRQITKYFGDLAANDGIDLLVERGSIHAIVGENGAGKSTLMNVLSGIYRPDGGEIRLEGRTVQFSGPIAASRAGIGMVHQEFMLYPELSVLENIIMGYEVTALPGVISRKKSRRAVQDICERYGFAIPLEAKTGALPVALLQQIEIVKVLYHGADIIIFDEPTSVLTPQGIEGLFRAFRALTQKGKTLLFITHKLQEVLAVADAVTVLKDGRVVCRTTPDEASEKTLARMMVGRDVLLEAGKLEKVPGEEVLVVEKLSVTAENGQRRVRGVSFCVRAGEIVGIAGIAGSGESELVAALFGLEPISGGSIRLCGDAVEKKSARERRQLGIGYVPQDRNAEGSSRGAAVWENCLMGYHVTHGFRHLIDHPRAYAFAREVVEAFSVKTASIFAPVGSLSGGNVQKLIVGREFLQRKRLLIIEDPTRGIDIGAISFIWQKIEEMAAAGVAILMVSHELSEVMQVSDRILVMNNGELLDGGARGEKTEEQLGILMMGGQTA